MSTTYQMMSLATNGSNLVVAAAPGYTADTLTSTDGITWTPTGFSFGSGTPNQLTFDGTYFYLGMSGAAPFLYRSTDGNTWDSTGISGVSGNVPYGSLWYNQGRYMLFDSTAGTVEKSSNGLTFSTLLHPNAAGGRTFRRAFPNAVITNSN